MLYFLFCDGEAQYIVFVSFYNSVSFESAAFFDSGSECLALALSFVLLPFHFPLNPYSSAAMEAAGTLTPFYPEAFSRCLVRKLSEGLQSGIACSLGGFSRGGRGSSSALPY